jgi:predicted esterase
MVASSTARAQMRAFATTLARVSLFLLVTFMVLRAPAAHAETRMTEDARGTSSSAGPEPKKRSVLAFPPENRGGKQPVFIYLHGIAGGPERGCAELAHAVPTYGWLVCPHANVRDGQKYSWGGSLAEQWAVVTQAVREVASEPEVDPSAPVVLLGFSQGAYVAADLVTAYPNKVRAALFVGANVRPQKDALVRSGVKKVAFTAGLYDGTHGYLAESARLLAAAGYPAQFRSLGKVGHTYVGDPEARALDSLISWMAND